MVPPDYSILMAKQCQLKKTNPKSLLDLNIYIYIFIILCLL